MAAALLIFPITETRAQIPLNTETTSMNAYKSEALVCGIDGGGTVTKVVVANLSGRVVFDFQADSINHYGVGLANAQACFGLIAERLAEQLGCLPGLIFVGNSALSDLADQALVQALTKGVFQKSTVIFHSDVYIALLGFTMGRAGAVLIAGTGSMACGVDPHGNYHTVGGWGQTLGDEGSGYYIGLEGMRAAIHGYDGLIPPTTLTERLLRYFELNTLAEIIAKIYDPPIEKKEIASFAIEVAQAAQAGDAAAANIVENAAQWLYRLALSITRTCTTQTLGYIGSVISHNSFIHTQLTQRLTPHGITLAKPLFSPEIGAIFGAFQAKGITITNDITKNLSTYTPS